MPNKELFKEYMNYLWVKEAITEEDQFPAPNFSVLLSFKVIFTCVLSPNTLLFLLSSSPTTLLSEIRRCLRCRFIWKYFPKKLPTRITIRQRSGFHIQDGTRPITDRRDILQ